MKINNYSKFFAKVAQIMNTSIKSVKQLDSRYEIELTNHVHFNVYRRVAGRLFIHDHRGIEHITSRYNFEDFKTLKDLYERLVIDYSESNNICLETAETTEETAEKHYADNNVTVEEIKEEPEEPEELKEVMEVKQELNARFGKEQYFDTDSLQPKIENINHCPNQNTCCIVSPFVHCDYNYKSDACIKAHKNFIHDCEQVHKQMKAISNSEWHHVRLAKLANIDIDTLDEKRQRYLKIYKELIKTVNDLHKCKTAATYEKRWLRFKQVIADDINYRGTTLYMTRFLDSKISMCNVECGLWSSADEKATSFIKSRRYRHTTLK